MPWTLASIGQMREQPNCTQPGTNCPAKKSLVSTALPALLKLRMSERLQIWGIFLAPLALVAALIGFGLTVPVPEFGRNYVQRVPLPEAGAQLHLPEIAGPEDASRPLVVIDPGHGGHDPGASGAGIREKTLVLSLARHVRDKLVEGGGIRVALTREDDRYLTLVERVEIARQLGADLFLSIHADSAGDKSGVTGASVYTLSEEASSEAAARFAERENRADRINGVDLSGRGDVVSTILVELSQRRSQGGADEFAGLIRREGTEHVPFHVEPRRSAALGVLRAPDIPSVLFEVGFLTNADEARRLSSPEQQDAFGSFMAQAIRVWFARRTDA